MRYLVACAVLLIAFPAAAQEPAVVIRNATVETLAAAGRLEQATVVVRGGKVEAVGKDVAIPDGAKVIDAAGGTLMPGIIEPHYEIAVAAPTTETPTAPAPIGGGRRGGFTPGAAPAGRGAFTRVADNFTPYDPAYRPLPRAGLTRLNLVTSGSGQAAVIRLSAGEPGQMLTHPEGIAYASVTNSSDSIDQVRARLEQIGGGGRGGPGRGGAPFAGRGGPGRGGPVAAAAASGNQLWQDVHAGKTTLLVNAANAAAIVHLMEALEPFKDVKVVVFAAGEALYESRDALAARKATALVRPGFELVPAGRDRLNVARALHEAGVEVAFTLTARPPAGGGGPTFVPTGADGDGGIAENDFPLFPTAMMVKTGLPRLAALEALTKRPAALLGLDKTHGTIEPGKAADLLLYSGDPLDPGSRLRLTLIDGRTAYAN